jgi:peptidoglycan-associated lipoprotein
MLKVSNYLFFLAIFVSFAAVGGCASPQAAKEEPAAPKPKVEKAEKVKKADEKIAVAQPKPDEVSKTEEIPKASAAPSGPFSIESLGLVHFDFDKFNIKPSERAILAANAEILKSHPEVSVVIEGHCDERGTAEYNMALGGRRAHSVFKYLVNLGVNENNLSTISYGEEKPLDAEHNEEAWAKNRRVQYSLK